MTVLKSQLGYSSLSHGSGSATRDLSFRTRIHFRDFRTSFGAWASARKDYGDACLSTSSQPRPLHWVAHDTYIIIGSVEPLSFRA